MRLWNSISEVVKMSPRTGRPKINNPKSNDVKVRLDDKTTSELDKYCIENNITRDRKSVV